MGLEDIERKLDTIISHLNQLSTLIKIMADDELDKLRLELKKDAVSKAIVQLCGNMTYSRCLEVVSKETGASERTVKRRLADLRSRGLLSDRREGKEVYLEVSSLLEV